MSKPNRSPVWVQCWGWYNVGLATAAGIAWGDRTAALAIGIVGLASFVGWGTATVLTDDQAQPRKRVRQ